MSVVIVIVKHNLHLKICDEQTVIYTVLVSHGALVLDLGLAQMYVKTNTVDIKI